MTNRATPPGSFPGALAAVLFDGPGRTVPKGVHIFRPGDLSQSLFLLRHGLVALSSLSPKGDEITLRVYRPEEFFGEGCFCHTVRRHWATALETSEVVEAPATRAIESLSHSPEVALELATNLTERLVSAYDDLQTLSSRVALNRVAAKLLTLPSIEDSRQRWVELAHRFTHEELAQIVGVRRETLSRSLSRLKELGIIEYAAGARMRMHRTALQDLLAANDPASSVIPITDTSNPLRLKLRL